MKHSWVLTCIVIALCFALVGCSSSEQKTADSGEKPSVPQQSGTTSIPEDAGLKKTDVKVGTGATVENGDLAYVEYTGTLTNGKQFDSNVGKDPYPVTVGAGQVIKGWDLGLVGMKVGGERKLQIPSSLAYGANAQGEIPPNSQLNFDLKLLGLVKAGEENVVDEKTLKPGSGSRQVKEGDTIEVEYSGRLVNGKEFDNSEKHGQPLKFKVGASQVIPGMDKGVLGMKLGESRQLTIPPAVGYGPVPQGEIPANSLLMFIVKLVSIK